MSDERQPLGPLQWVVAGAAVLVVLGGQWLWVSGQRGLGGTLVAAGGLVLAAIILRAALAGLPRRPKR